MFDYIAEKVKLIMNPVSMNSELTKKSYRYKTDEIFVFLYFINSYWLKLFTKIMLDQIGGKIHVLQVVVCLMTTDSLLHSGTHKSVVIFRQPCISQGLCTLIKNLFAG